MGMLSRRLGLLHFEVPVENIMVRGVTDTVTVKVLSILWPKLFECHLDRVHNRAHGGVCGDLAATVVLERTAQLRRLFPDQSIYHGWKQANVPTKRI